MISITSNLLKKLRAIWFRLGFINEKQQQQQQQLKDFHPQIKAPGSFNKESNKLSDTVLGQDTF